jgi:DNA-binding NtrC family response regulator
MNQFERRLLHVDDDPAILRVVQQRLKRRGFAVESTRDPRECLDLVIEKGYRVVLTDLDMPEMSGLELIRRIKDCDGGIQVVVLSGLVKFTTALDSMRAGAESCVFKPIVKIDPLVTALEQAFAKIEYWAKSLRDLKRLRIEQTVKS